MIHSIPAWVLCILTLAGLFFLIDGWLDIRLGRITEAWPEASGHVLSSEVRGAPFGPGNVVAEVRYSYRVNGATLHSDRLTFRHFASVRQAELAAYHFPVGSSVKVYYDPARPERSVLMPGTGSLPWLRAGFGAMAIATAGAIFVFA